MAPNTTGQQDTNHELRSGYDKPLSVNQFLRQTSVKAEPPKKPIVFQKSIVTLFASLSAFIMFLLRYNLSVSIIGMTEDKSLVLDGNSTDMVTDKFRFDWHDSEKQLALILGSYFWGYTACQVPAGRLAERFGAKWVIGLGVLFSGIFTLATPLCADLGLGYFIICRLCTGAFHATVLSSCYTLFNAWILEKDKVKAVCWINIAFEIGGMTTLFLSGLISSEPRLGWQYTFWLFSIVAFVWFVPYCVLVYSEPSQNPRVSNYERKLLEQSKTIEHLKEDFSTKYVKVPPKFIFKKIFTSGPVWASCIAKFASKFGHGPPFADLSGLIFGHTNVFAYFGGIKFVPKKRNRTGYLKAMSTIFCLMFAGHISSASAHADAPVVNIPVVGAGRQYSTVTSFVFLSKSQF